MNQRERLAGAARPGAAGGDGGAPGGGAAQLTLSQLA